MPTEDLESARERENALLLKQNYESRIWWFRRIAVTLALGNAAGVLALGGLIGNSNSITAAAPFIFRPLPYFLSGANFAILIFVTQFIYCLVKIDIKIEEIDRESAASKHLDHPSSLTKNDLKLIAYLSPMFILILLSISYFYLGSRIVIEEANYSACPEWIKKTPEQLAAELPVKGAERDRLLTEKLDEQRLRVTACNRPRPFPWPVLYPAPK